MAILKACRNKNIVTYLADYVDDERTWLIMEYMEVWPVPEVASQATNHQQDPEDMPSAAGCGQHSYKQ